jgi:hypothetical protein
LVGTPERKIKLNRSRRILEDNIRMDLSETGWQGVDSMQLAQEKYQRLALVNTIKKLR